MCAGAFRRKSLRANSELPLRVAGLEILNANSQPVAEGVDSPLRDGAIWLAHKELATELPAARGFASCHNRTLHLL